MYISMYVVFGIPKLHRRLCIQVCPQSLIHFYLIGRQVKKWKNINYDVALCMLLAKRLNHSVSHLCIHHGNHYQLEKQGEV